MDQPDDQSSDSVSCLKDLDTNDSEMTQDKEEMGELPEKPKDLKPPSHSKNESYENFLKELNEQGNAEQKISYTLTYMEKAISDGGTPSFKNFWDARKVCLSLFKEENLSFSVRSHLWNQYVELSKEAHRLKEVLDEQSSFAAEQIDLAIKALENDIEKLNESDHYGPEVIFDPPSKFLDPKRDEYLSIQRELSLLNAFAAKINALRKELIKTEMRIRFKNKFFQRLSVAGDKIFPVRKKLIKSISQLFLDDITQFIEDNFSSSNFKQPLFFLREEIKALQGVAKVLTLNTQAFNQTRMKLSECWDKIKKIEKERKKEKAKLKASFKENADKIEDKIKELETQYEAGNLDDTQVSSHIQEISQIMRQFHLEREDLKLFRDRLNKVRADLTKKMTAAEDKRLAHERQQQQKLEQQFTNHLDELQTLMESIETRSIEEVIAEIERVTQEIAKLKLSKSQQHDFDRQIQILNDKISQQKIRNLPQNELEAYEQLKILLDESKKRRKEIKEKLEIYRKASGSSGFDIEQALKQSELLDHEKERLEKVDEEISQIREKIKSLET